jgi:ribosome recycling factor
LNLNPISDGKNLKVPIPKPTKEHRDNMVKIANKAAEQARTRIRSVRQDGMKDLKKDQKAGLSEDEVKKLEKQVYWRRNYYPKFIGTCADISLWARFKNTPTITSRRLMTS